MTRKPASAHVLRRSLSRQIDIEWWWLVGALVVLTLVLTVWGKNLGLQRLDYLLYDVALGTTHYRQPSKDIVIITIDDASLDALGHWPWRRAVHAQLLEQLNTAKGVGIDLILSDLNPSYPRDDQLLARAIAAQGHVVLPQAIEETAGRLVAPLFPLTVAANGVGYINIQNDEDGSIRSVSLQRRHASETLDHFAVALAVAGGDHDAVKALDNRQEQKRIAYNGPPGSFVMIPYHEVLDGTVPASSFDDKYVLVGAWALGLGDVYSVPSSRGGEPMAGVEVLANVLQGVLENHWIRTPPQGLMLLFAVLPVLLTCIGFRRLSPRQAFLWSVGVALVLLAICWLVIGYLDYWLAPAASLVCVLLAYPLWSWRSQEIALRHIDEQLRQLKTEKLIAEQFVPEQFATLADRSLPARIHALHEGVGLLRHSIHQREKTLHFLSHDMRSPQSSILALTQLRREGQEAALSETQLLDRVDYYAGVTLGLVDGFVQLARAESMTFDFREVNLLDILFDTCDARWPQTQKKNMRIVFEPDISEAAVWGDAAVLTRALGNLLDNAVNYSSNGTEVQVDLMQSDSCWEISVRDQGRGIAPDELDTIFLPFERAREQGEGTKGSGLGLPYVQTVIQRHRGRVTVVSTPGSGSTFTVYLPIFQQGMNPA